MSSLALELCISVLQVGSPNSVKGRMCLVNTLELGMGLIVLMARGSDNVLTKGECWYFFVWELKGARLYLFNASSRH